MIFWVEVPSGTTVSRNSGGLGGRLGRTRRGHRVGRRRDGHRIGRLAVVGAVLADVGGLGVDRRVQALDLGRRSIYAATHRDAYSGNTINLYHMGPNGWTFIANYDVMQLHYDGVPEQVPGTPAGGYGYDVRTQGLSSRDNAA